MMMKPNPDPLNLDERLVAFAVKIIDLATEVYKCREGRHLSDQIIRSGTSSALNYGEARSAESRRDFIHKVRIVLKELRETSMALKIIGHSRLPADENVVHSLIKENNELIAIFIASINTALKNQKLASVSNKRDGGG